MKRTKLLALLLCLAMVFSLTVPALAVEVTPYAPEADMAGKLVILHTNDTHGRDVAVEGTTVGTAGVAALKKELEAAGAEVLLLSNGDFSQGTTLVSLSKGAAAVEFMNAAGYDAASLGNHEFDYKMDALEANVALAKFPILAANIVDTATGKPMFGDRVIFETELGKVGVFGLNTPETMTKAHPDNVAGLTFYQGQELYDCAQAQVDALKAAGCDVIVALGHLGTDPESEPNRSVDVLANVTGIDLFIDGHSHTEFPEGQKQGDTLLVSTGEYLNNVGMVTYDGTAFTARLISAAAYTKVDAEVAAVVNKVAAEVSAELDKVFAKTEVLLDGARDPGVRTMETNLGDFAADAILWAAKQSQGDDVVVAITNGGGIRESIAAGDITMNDMKTVFPFGNEVSTLTVTGAQLLEALEAATCSTPNAIGAFPQVAGITFTIDTSVPYVNGEMYPDSTYYAPANPGARIKDVMVAGQPLDLTKEYKVATNDFTAAGGDTYYAFKEANDANGYKTGVALEEALVNYTDEVLGGVITAAKYGTSAGRINIYLFPSDVVVGAWYYDAVKYVYDAGLMTGVGGNLFNPAGTVTRATVFQTLYNAEGRPAVSGTTFTDVAGMWYGAAAAWAESTGLAVVPADGTFNGDRNITRAEIATIFARYAQYEDMAITVGSLDGFGDAASVGDWAKEGMCIAVGSGIIGGKPGPLLDPAGTAIRTELATILKNYANLVPAAVVEGKGASVSKYGNVTTDIPVAAFEQAGFVLGDILRVTIGDTEIFAPYGDGYSNVDAGSVIILPDGDKVAIAINMGNFSTTYGLVEGVAISFSMKEKGGYLEEYAIRNIDSKRTNVRADYASDEVFANFRPIVMGDIAEGVLYRASSPVNNELGRAATADALAKAAGIATVINLADSKEVLEGYFAAAGFASPYYKGLYDAGAVTYLDMGVDLGSDDFKAKLKTGLEAMAEAEGPVLFHCNEGKDRAGYFAMVLEALMGGELDEIVADYMRSFENFYHVEKGSSQWAKIADSNVMANLCAMAGLSKGADLSGVDLAAAAETYLLGIGVSADDIAALKTLLSTPVVVAMAA